MPTVKFTYALKRFFPGLKDTMADGNTLPEILGKIESVYPGVKSYVLDEQGSLRRHVNIFIDGVLINDRSALTHAVNENSEIYIIQALSGG
jgi:molybdopterin converting factor small subunit